MLAIIAIVSLTMIGCDDDTNPSSSVPEEGKVTFTVIDAKFFSFSSTTANYTGTTNSKNLSALSITHGNFTLSLNDAVEGDNALGGGLITLVMGVNENGVTTQFTAKEGIIKLSTYNDNQIIGTFDGNYPE